MMIQKEKQRVKNEVLSRNKLRFPDHRSEKLLRCLTREILEGGRMVAYTRKKSVFFLLFFFFIEVIC